MSNTRVCPNCSNILADYDNYFCSNCSTQLPEELNKLPVSLKVREFTALFPLLYRPKKTKKVLKPKKQKEVEEPVDTRKKSFNEKMIVLLSIVLIILSSVFLALYVYLNFYKSVKPKEITLTAKKSVSNKTLDLKLEAKETNFGKNTLLSYVPSSAIFYAEFSDVNYFAQKIGGSPFSIDESEFDLLKKQLKNEFVLFSFNHKNTLYWAGVFKLIDAEKTAFFVKTFENPYFNLSVEDGNLLVIQKDAPKDAVEAIRVVKKGQSLNLSLNPSFIKAMNLLPAIGQVRLIMLDKDQKQGLLHQLSQNLRQSDQELVSRIIGSKFNELVIRRTND